MYVDDLLITGSDTAKISKVKNRLKEEFEMTDLGEPSYFLGMEFYPTKQGIVLHQKKYAKEVLKRFNMFGCNVAATPMKADTRLEASKEEEALDSIMVKQVVGSVRYLCWLSG